MGSCFSKKKQENIVPHPEIFERKIVNFIKQQKKAQDRLFIYENKETNFIAMCIMDGHGRYGTTVVITVKKYLEDFCKNNCQKFNENNAVEWINNAYTLTNKEVKNLQCLKDQKHGGGTTCTFCILYENILYVANMGDSTAILFSKNDISKLNVDELQYKKEIISKSSNYVILSGNHSPENIYEQEILKERNEEETYKIIYDKSSKRNKFLLPWFNETKPRIYKTIRNDPAISLVIPSGHCLSMTRSFGDYIFKDIILREPTITKVDISGLNDCCLAICSDGVWDQWKYEEFKDLLFEENLTNLLNNNKLDKISQIISYQNETKQVNFFKNDLDDASGIFMYF